jgi:proliferating cell nuclear antigen PCNA
MNIPEMDYQADFAIPSVNFSTMINQLEMFGGTLQIQCSEDKIIFSSTSSDNGKMAVNIPIDDLSSFAIQEDISLNLSFSLRHLHNVTLYSKLTKNVELNISNNFPVKIKYDLGNEARFAFYLAPKIDDDDE